MDNEQRANDSAIQLSSNAKRGQSGKSKKMMLLYWSRWIIAVPAAVLVVIAVTFPLHWAVMLLKFTFESGESFITLDPGYFPAEIVERLGNAFFTPATFTYTAGRVIPAFRLQIAGVLVLLQAVFIGGGWALDLFGVKI